MEDLEMEDLRAQKHKLIHDRESAWKIMKISRIQYQEMRRRGLHAAASTMMASTYYTLIKRKVMLMPFRMFMSTAHARQAWKFGLTSFGQINTVATILSLPRLMGGEPKLALQIINDVLNRIPVNEPVDEMLPHDRALMHIVAGKVYVKQGHMGFAWGSYVPAYELIPAIRQENSPDKDEQLVRVLVAVAFFFYDYGDRGHKQIAQKLLVEADDLARKVSKDQLRKIQDGAWKRGIRIYPV